jgi:hypothetical protein
MVWPATVNEPVRELVVVFAATAKPTVPLPVPLAPAVMVIQESFATAVQAQPELVVTDVDVVPPPATNPTFVGLTMVEHDASCATVTVWPAMVSVPVRGVPVVFAAML